MIESLLNLSDAILAALQSWGEFLAGAPLLVAVPVALLVSWGGSQWIKRSAGWYGDRIRAVSFLLGFLVCYSIASGLTLWPVDIAGLWIAAAVGLFSPLAYDAARLLLRRRFPWVDELSNAPGKPKSTVGRKGP